MNGLARAPQRAWMLLSMLASAATWSRYVRSQPGPQPNISAGGPATRELQAGRVQTVNALQPVAGGLTADEVVRRALRSAVSVWGKFADLDAVLVKID